ncbi:hypothetical protein JCM5353_001933 [Sporobolomyces roseus]
MSTATTQSSGSVCQMSAGLGSSNTANTTMESSGRLRGGKPSNASSFDSKLPNPSLLSPSPMISESLHPALQRLLDIKFTKPNRITAPASIIISIAVKYLPPNELTTKDGVTVEEVLVGIANFRSSTPPKNEVRGVRAMRAEEKEIEREMNEENGEWAGNSDSDESSEEEEGPDDDSSSDEGEVEAEQVTWLEAIELKKRKLGMIGIAV